MARFLIEVPHAATKEDCMAAIEIFMKTGSHFLTNADWGCGDGEHKAWITLEAANKEEARHILPPAYRARASIVALNKFTMDTANNVVAQHEVAR